MTGESAAGKLNLSFRLGRNSVAGGRAIFPGANRAQHVAVSRGSRTLQDERTVHVAVSPNDKADLHLGGVCRRAHQWRRRGKRLGRLLVAAAGGCGSGVRYIAELGGLGEWPPGHQLTLGQRSWTDG